ncbi:MAG: hypothetical protein OXQ29_23130 [Rhodospirillaceae bacterium]|nr:hypothetical protein [Rhodospirillaceae bacterium]
MPSTAIDESALSKGQLRKLNALRKSVGKEIGERAFADWIAARTASNPRDDNAVRIADALWPLVEQGVLRIPRPGYLVKRGRGRIVVEPADS